MATSITKAGKEFEKDFENSFPDSMWVYRIPDNSTSFGGGTGSRFAQESRYDYLIYNNDIPALFALELKSTEGTSIAMCDYALSAQYERSKRAYETYRQNIKGKQNVEQKACIASMKDSYKALEKKCKAKSIKYHQIKNLREDSYKGLRSYFIFNFREYNTTYALPIEEFIKFWENTDKKSINQDDIRALEHCIIPQEQIRKTKHWSYNVEEFTW